MNQVASNAIKLIIMKYLIIVFLAIVTTIKFDNTQKEKLYLLFCKNDSRITRSHFISDDFETYTYSIKFKGEKYETFAFDEFNPPQKDSISISKLPSIQYRNIEWLTKKYFTYFNYFKDKDAKVNSDGSLRVFNLNKMYESIFIIVPDSSSEKAVITEVEYNPYFSID